MKRWKSSVVFLASLLLCIASVLVPIRAEAAYGELLNWNGNLNLGTYSVKAPLIYKDNYSYDYSLDTGDITVDSYYALYEGYVPLRLIFTDLEPGCAYVGTAQRSVTVSFETLTGTPYTLDIDYLTFDSSSLPDGITFFCSNTSADTYLLKFDFNGYVPTSETLNVVMYANARVIAINNSNSNYQARMILNNSQGTDTSGILKYYTDLRDVPNNEGFFADQNQQIIDGIDENTGVLEDLTNNLSTWFSDLTSNLSSWFSDQKANINSRFSELTSNLTSWYNGLTATINNGFDRLLNSYSGTGTTDAANKFDDSAGDLEQVESDLTGITNSNIDSYTESAFDTSVITSLGSSLVYVVTWFTNFWNMGGLFTSILNVGLALSVAFFVLRLRGGS